jgi:hypothetical protein
MKIMEKARKYYVETKNIFSKNKKACKNKKFFQHTEKTLQQGVENVIIIKERRCEDVTAQRIP